MVAVGLYAASLGGAALWLVPCAFVGMMIVGGLIGYGGVPLPMVEQAIGLSVVVMGLAIALGARLRLVVAMGLVGLFALFHGHAHGSEGLGLASFLPYAAGFIAATVGLHMAGIGIGLGLDRLGTAQADYLRRTAGAVGALAGVSLMLGWLTV
jgi:urease accessory protein